MARAATLTLASVDDPTDEGAGEAVTVGLGTLDADSGAGLGGGASGAGSLAFTITDDDLPPPVVTIAVAPASMVEGGSATFTVSADRAPDAALAVPVAVTDAPGADYIAQSEEGTRTVTIPSGDTSAAFTLRTPDDALDEPDGPVTATLGAGDGYTLGSPASASVQVKDDDASVLPTLSIEDAEAEEGKHMRFTIRLSAPLDRTVRLRVRFQESDPVSARGNFDWDTRTFWQGAYDFIPKQWYVDIPRGETVAYRSIPTIDDAHDEEDETFEGHIRWADVPIADGVAIGTIRNDDPLPAAYLARFGRTVAQQVLDAIADRTAADRTPGMRGALAGAPITGSGMAGVTGEAENTGTDGFPAVTAETEKSLAGFTGVTAEAEKTLAGFTGVTAEAEKTLAGFTGVTAEAEKKFPAVTAEAEKTLVAFASVVGETDVNGFPDVTAEAGINGFPDVTADAEKTMTLREAFLGSSFNLTGGRDASGGSLSFWGRVSEGSFDGAERGDGTDITLDGTVTTGLLGADYARDDWLMGLALAHSSSEGGYSAMGDNPCSGTEAVLCDGAVRFGDGDVEASLTAAIPYASMQATDALKIWGAVGYGTGEVTLKTEPGDRYRAGTDWTMAAAGLRGDLLEAPEGGGLSLAVTSDALWTETSSEGTRDLESSKSNTTRLRLGLESSWKIMLENSGSLTPKLELGLRHDGGDAETGTGTELGAGVSWHQPQRGLSLDISGRTLVSHEDDDLEDRGFAGSLSYDPAPSSGRGLSLQLRQETGGQSEGGLDVLFAPTPLADRTGGGASTSRWTMEAAYGLPAYGGRYTGSPHAGLGISGDSRDWSVGWRVSPEGESVPDISFGVKATRRESGTESPSHVLGFEFTGRW